MIDNNNNPGKTIKQRRLMIPLTLQELATTAGVSSSHLGRIERGERFPSAHVLRKMAEPLGLGESELFMVAGYLSPRSPVETEERHHRNGLNPYVASVLTQEPVEVQSAVIVILSILKSFAKNLDGAAD